MWGGTDSESLLPKSFREELASEVEDLPKNLRHDDPSLLLGNILKPEVIEILLDKCRQILWTWGMQPTMIPIAISANLKAVSLNITGGYCNCLRPKSLLINLDLILSTLCFWIQFDAIHQTYNACNACKEADAKYKKISNFFGRRHLQAQQNRERQYKYQEV